MMANPIAASAKPPALIAPSSPTDKPRTSAFISSTRMTSAMAPSADENVMVRNFRMTKAGTPRAKRSGR